MSCRMWYGLLIQPSTRIRNNLSTSREAGLTRPRISHSGGYSSRLWLGWVGTHSWLKSRSSSCWSRSCDRLTRQRRWRGQQLCAGSSATLSTTLNSFSAGNGESSCRCGTSPTKSEYPFITCAECSVALLDLPSINTVRSCASAGLWRASWSRTNPLWILPWMRDSPATVTTPVPSARNLLKLHRAFEPAGLQNRGVGREQYFDSAFARDRLISRNYADESLSHHREILSWYIPCHWSRMFFAAQVQDRDERTNTRCGHRTSPGKRQ